MANVYAVKSGNWSDTTVWNTGALPTAADDVFSNNFTVTVDISPTVLTIRNTSASGITQGGAFVATNNTTLTCTASVGLIAAANNLYSSSLGIGQSTSLIANVSVSGSNSQGYMVANNGAGTLNITGTLTGNTVATTEGAVINFSTGTVNVFGSCVGGASGGSGARNQSTGVINVIGNVSGGAGIGVRNGSSGTVNVTGSVNGGSSGTGLANISTGTINITGTATGGTSTGAAFSNNSSGTINHIGTAQASATAAAIGAGSASQVTILTGPLLSTDATVTGAPSSGVNPCIALRWFPADTALGTFEYRMRGATVTGGIRPQRSFYLPDAYETAYPVAGDVRLSTTYGPANIYTGTLAVPPPGSVAFGVAVGATTGTAAIDVNSIASALASASAVTLNQPTNTLNTPGSIGERLKLASTVATTAQQLSDALSNE